MEIREGHNKFYINDEQGKQIAEIEMCIRDSAIPMVKLGHGLDLTVVRAQLLMDLPEVIRTCKLGQTGNI